MAPVSWVTRLAAWRAGGRGGDGVSHPDPIAAGDDGPLGATPLVQWGGDVTPPRVTDVLATSVTSDLPTVRVNSGGTDDGITTC